MKNPSAILFLAVVWLDASALAICADAQPEKSPKKPAMVAGKAEVLRAVPKRFAKIANIDVAQRRVTLLVEGENLAKVWPVALDAEIKLFGWWGRLDQLAVNDRVWVWFNIDRSKQPTSILMIADEWTEQDIHGNGVTVESRTKNELIVKEETGKKRTLKLGIKEIVRGQNKAASETLKEGEKVYIQSNGLEARQILDRAAFEERRSAQKSALRKRWVSDGLPGTVIFLHLSGEMEIMLDHETMRWSRWLKLGDAVTVATAKPIAAQVQQVRPWRERTQVRLVVAGFDEADLTIGQRVFVRMAAPPPEVEKNPLPPDIGRSRSKEDRVEWFLASIYCPCGVKGDGCTGNFYTLASCNPNGCGMPNFIRQKIGAAIDQGKSDQQVFDLLLKEHGADLLLQPHLVP